MRLALRFFLARAHVTQKDAAPGIGISMSALSNWLNGKPMASGRDEVIAQAVRAYLSQKQ
eukprot:239820-Pleurochrysis_carterae.AAC.1